MMDLFQKRYQAHQAKKKQQLMQLMRKRHSTRLFSSIPLTKRDLNELYAALKLCPSSCDRKGVTIQEVSDRTQKELLGGLLVGGVGWIHRASHIFLLVAHEEAYKEKLDYMQYLDAGVMIEQVYLMATACGIKCCFVNPNIRPVGQDYFHCVFGIPYARFCGAIALGYEDKS